MAEGPLVSLAPVVEPFRTNRHLLRAVATLTSAGIAVKAISTCKEFTLAGIFGRSDSMDAFLAAFLIPNLLINVIAESMNQALLPALIRVRLHDGHRKARELLSNSILCSSVLMLLTSLALAVTAPLFFRLIAWNFEPAKVRLALGLFYVLLPSVLLTGIASHGVAVLNTVERFMLPALAPVLVPLSIVSGSLLLHRQIGIWAVAFFTSIGSACFVALISWSARAHGYPLRFHWYGWNEPTLEVARQYGPVVLSSVVASAGLLVDQAMASALPPGSVSALVFAGRFVSVAVSLFSGAISSTLAPHFSKLVAQKDWVACRRTLSDWRRFTGAIAVLLAAGLMLASHMLIRMTLEHGAFGTRDTAIVAPVLVVYAIQIPFFACSRVDYRFLLAMRRSDLILYCGIVNLVLDVVLDWLLMHWFGLVGLALATSIWTIATWMFLRFWSQRLLSTICHDGKSDSEDSMKDLSAPAHSGAA